MGAEKARTTSSYRYLDDHPDVYMSPIREPRYFNFAGEGVVPPPPGPHFPQRRGWVADREAYEQLFAGVAGERAVGEASTSYLQSQRAATRIREEIPDVRIVVNLRDPVDRAFSAHRLYALRGKEPIQDFESAVDAELAGTSPFKYVAHSRYSATCPATSTCSAPIRGRCSSSTICRPGPRMWCGISTPSSSLTAWKAA